MSLAKGNCIDSNERERWGEKRTKERPKSETFKTVINTKKLWALNTILSATTTYQNSIN